MSNIRYFRNCQNVFRNMAALNYVMLPYTVESAYTRLCCVIFNKVAP